MGARPEPVPQVVQAPADSVSARLGEVHDLSQAIKSIRWEREQQVAQGKQVAAKPCIDSDCMPYYFSEKMEVGPEMDVKLQPATCKCVYKLLSLLSLSYLRLGQAYLEDGQFNRAVKAVELACFTRNRSLQYYGNRFREEKLRQLKDLRDTEAAKFVSRIHRLTPPPKEAFNSEAFESQAWILAGDAYLEAQRTFDDSDVVIPHQEGEDLKMEQEVEKERHRAVMSFRYFSFMLLRDYPLPRIVENKWEKNLPAAVKCYSKALPWKDQLTLDIEDSASDCTEDEGSGFTKIAFRKVGFACHECGRRLAELGWHAKDETDKFFRLAIKAFYKGKDVPNLELALCSRIEYHRKLAEFLETHWGIKAIEETRVQYQKALDLCSEAKRRLMEWGDGLHKEVDTEVAHTYFKLAMFLMSVGKQKEPLNRIGQISAKEAIHEAMNLYNKVDSKQEVTCSQYQLGYRLQERLLFESVKSGVTVPTLVPTEEAYMYLKLAIMLMGEDKLYYDNQEEPNRKGRISAEEAIQEAISLYKKLDCKQGVAYAQYRRGCVHRDRMLFDSVKSAVTGLQEKKLSDIWLEPSKYYLGVANDSDMYLRIRMEHCDLYLAMRLKSRMNKGLDQALIQLLEACCMVVFNKSSVSEEFIRKLLKLLKTMRKAAKPQHNIASSSSSPANDYEFLKGMYRRALELKGGVDYRPLYYMFVNYRRSVKS